MKKRVNVSAMKLVEEHMYLAKAEAQRAARFAPSSMEQADLVQLGALGLMAAARRFDPSRGAFGMFARICVRWAIRDGIRTELDKAVGLCVSQICEAPGDEPFTIETMALDGSLGPEGQAIAREGLGIIRKLLGKRAEMFLRYYLWGWTFNRIGKMARKSEWWARRQIYNCLAICQGSHELRQIALDGKQGRRTTLGKQRGGRSNQARPADAGVGESTSKEGTGGMIEGAV